MMIMLVMILIFCRRKKYLGWQNLHQSLASQLPHQRVLASILNSSIVCNIYDIYDLSILECGEGALSELFDNYMYHVNSIDIDGNI